MFGRNVRTLPTRTQTPSTTRPYRGIWRKWLLIPCWILQPIAAGIALAAGIIALAANDILDDYDYSNYANADDIDRGRRGLEISGAIYVVFSSVTILLCLLEIFWYARHMLHPAWMLTSQCVKMPMWIFYTVTAFASLASGTSGWTIAIALVLLLSNLALLIHAAINVHHKRKGRYSRGDYAPAATDGRHARSVSEQDQTHEMYATNPAGPHLVPGANDPFQTPPGASRQPSQAPLGQVPSVYGGPYTNGAPERRQEAFEYYGGGDVGTGYGGQGYGGRGQTDRYYGA